MENRQTHLLPKWREEYSQFVQEYLDRLPATAPVNNPTIVEALRSIIDASQFHAVAPPLRGWVDRIVEILDHPEMVVRNRRNREEFKQIVLAKTAAKIASLSQAEPFHLAPVEDMDDDLLDVRLTVLQLDARRFIESALQNPWTISYARDGEKNNAQTLLATIEKYSWAILFAGDLLKASEDFNRRAVELAPEALQFVPLCFRTNEAFLLSVIKLTEGRALQFAPPQFRHSQNFIPKALKTHPDAIQYVEKSLTQNGEFMLKAIAITGQAIKCASEGLRDDFIFMHNAVRINGRVLMCGSEAVRNNPEIVTDAIMDEPSALAFAGPALKQDWQFNLNAIKICPTALLYVDKTLLENTDFLLSAIQITNGKAFPFVPEAFRFNQAFVLDALAVCLNILAGVDESWRSDMSFMLKAIDKNIEAFQYASDSLKISDKFILQCIEHNGLVLRLLAEERRMNKKIALAAVRQNKGAYEFVHESLKHNRDIVRALSGTSNCCTFL